MLLGRTGREPTCRFYQERGNRYRLRDDCNTKMDARIRLENSQPADREATSEGVHQALVGGNEISTRGSGHRNVGAVANGSVEIAGDLRSEEHTSELQSL